MRIEANQQQEVISIGAELATIQTLQAITPVDFFKPSGSDQIISALKEEVRKRAAQLDISTEAKRKALASLAYQVAKSKTFLDNKRKELVSDEKKRLKAIDIEGARIWEELEALQEEIRKPLTDWENAEKERVATHEMAINQIHALSILDQDSSVAEIEAKIADVLLIGKRQFEEFSKPAQVAIDQALGSLESARVRTIETIKEKEELERLRKESAERAAKDREEAIAREAREKAQRESREREEEAKRYAEAERMRIEEERFRAEARAKQAEAAAEQRRIVTHQFAIGKLKSYAEWLDINASTSNSVSLRERLISAASYFEREWEEFSLEAGELFAQINSAYETAIATAEEREAVSAQQEVERKERLEKERLEREKQAAIEAERQRVAEEKRKEAEEAEKRAKNRANQAQVNRAVLDAMKLLGVPEELSKSLIAAIAKKQIPHITITY